MKIQFYLRFHTEVGQSLWISGNVLMKNNCEETLPMTYLSADFWQAKIELTSHQQAKLHL
jgi:4-alpha-glucanotransferase